MVIGYMVNGIGGFIVAIFLLENNVRCRREDIEAKIVRAKTEKAAREFANISVSTEGKIWNDKNKVSCKEILPDGEDEEIITSYV